MVELDLYQADFIEGPIQKNKSSFLLASRGSMHIYF